MRLHLLFRSLVPPQMTHDHDEYTVIVNNPIQLPCEVAGIPPPDIVWKKSGDDIDYDGSDNFVQLPNGALRISHVRIEDGGLYECIATSVAGSASKIVTLNVQGKGITVVYYVVEIDSNKQVSKKINFCEVFY